MAALKLGSHNLVTTPEQALENMKTSPMQRTAEWLSKTAEERHSEFVAPKPSDQFLMMPYKWLLWLSFMERAAAIGDGFIVDA